MSDPNHKRNVNTSMTRIRKMMLGDEKPAKQDQSDSMPKDTENKSKQPSTDKESQNKYRNPWGYKTTPSFLIDSKLEKEFVQLIKQNRKVAKKSPPSKDSLDTPKSLNENKVEAGHIPDASKDGPVQKLENAPLSILQESPKPTPPKEAPESLNPTDEPIIPKDVLILTHVVGEETSQSTLSNEPPTTPNPIEPTVSKDVLVLTHAVDEEISLPVWSNETSKTLDSIEPVIPKPIIPKDVLILTHVVGQQTLPQRSNPAVFERGHMDNASRKHICNNSNTNDTTDDDINAKVLDRIRQATEQLK